MARYQYGIVRLEEIPECDKVSSPNIVIIRKEINGYELYYSAFRFFYYDVTNGKVLESTLGAKVYRHKYLESNGKCYWGEAEELASLYEFGSGDLYHYFSAQYDHIAWTNDYVYDKADNIVMDASPAPKWIFPIVDWLTGLALGELEKPPTTVRRKENYCNEWPIQWTFPEVAGNYNIPISDGNIYVHTFVKVSDLLPDWGKRENLELDITEYGITTTYKYSGELGVAVFFKNDAGDMVSLDFIYYPQDGFLGAVYYEQSGIYCVYEYGDTYEKKYTLRLTEAEPDEPQQPISYSYNGVILPALPEWDREKYPYAYITSAIGYYLFVSTKPLKASGSYIYDASLYTIEATTILGWECFNAEYEWEESSFTSGSNKLEEEANSKVSSGTIKWANTDVYFNDATTLCLAASDPIPIYE